MPQLGDAGQGPLRRPLWLGYRLEELAAEAEETGIALVLPHPVRRHAGERAVRAGRVPPPPGDVVALPAWSVVHAVEAGSTQTASTEQALTFDTERSDSNAYHSTSSNTSRITVPSLRRNCR